MIPPQSSFDKARTHSEYVPRRRRWLATARALNSIDCFAVALAVALALGFGGPFGVGMVQAGEVSSLHRSGEWGHFDAIPINSLPHHRPPSASATTASGQPDPVRVLDPARIESTAAPQSPGPQTRSDFKSSHQIDRSRDRVVEGKLARGQSLSSALVKRGISASTVRLIDRTMRPEFDFRSSRPGQGYRLIQSASGVLKSFRYRIDPQESLVMRRRAGSESSGFVVERKRAILRAQVTRLHGTVRSSLYESIKRLGEIPSLASDFADIFAWDIDFSRQLKSGDDFTILYERLYRDDDGQAVYVRPGRILAARLDGAVGKHTAVYFEESEGVGHYYRPDGDSLEQEFLVAPLKFSRISSGYSSARYHPILNIVRPHHGIDYAAREGTPVWSVADGTVIFRGANGGFGNLVKIRHSNGYVTYYPHLSGFAEAQKVGQRVLQKQVIGYVGHTGLATGPHVCFRVTKNGHYVNPASLNRGKPVLRSIDDSSWAEFEIVRDHLLASMHEAGSPELAENAL